jgi:hypothetical protein
MQRIINTVFTGLLMVAGPNGLAAENWIFDSGPYTRSVATGKRVDQYEPLPHVDRIPFEKYFSEDGPHPFAMDWWWGGDWSWYGGENQAGFDGGDSPLWGAYPFAGPYIYPWSGL